MARNRGGLLESLNIDSFCEQEDVRVYSRSTSAILDSRVAVEPHSHRHRSNALRSGVQNPKAMALPQKSGHVADQFSYASPEGREGIREAARRPGVAAECGLCLDEFLDCGNKVPRNLLCGHTFCTGWCKLYSFIICPIITV